MMSNFINILNAEFAKASVHENGDPVENFAAVKNHILSTLKSHGKCVNGQLKIRIALQSIINFQKLLSRHSPNPASFATEQGKSRFIRGDNVDGAIFVSNSGEISAALNRAVVGVIDQIPEETETKGDMRVDVAGIMLPHSFVDQMINVFDLNL